MDANLPLVIIPNQVEGWLSGVCQVEIAADQRVRLIYDDRTQISVRLEFLPHALQANFFAPVRSVQNASRAAGQRFNSGRLR